MATLLNAFQCQNQYGNELLSDLSNFRYLFSSIISVKPTMQFYIVVENEIADAMFVVQINNAVVI